MTQTKEKRERKRTRTTAIKVAYKSNKHRWTGKLNTDEGDE